MLLGISTPHDAGIGIYGDYNDLKCLHETIHHLCNHPNVEEHLGEFVLGFAYPRNDGDNESQPASRIRS